MQNSSRIQKISIKFAVVIGVNVVCICLIVTYKGTKNISLLQLFEHFSYIELTLKTVFLMSFCNTCDSQCVTRDISVTK